MLGDTNGGLTQATDNYLYGTAASDGANGAGTVFKITPIGTLTTLYNFCAPYACADGSEPQAGLIQGGGWELLRDHRRQWRKWPWHDFSYYPVRGVQESI